MMTDILIRGVRFPKDNLVSFTLYPDGTISWREYHEFVKHENITNGALIVQYPHAIELPVHGDLIDRLDTLNMLNMTWDLYPNDRKLIGIIYDQIKDQTAVIPTDKET